MRELITQEHYVTLTHMSLAGIDSLTVSLSYLPQFGQTLPTGPKSILVT